MERRDPVTQQTVNEACASITKEGKNVSVNAVIAAVGGSFTTVGKMVKVWRKEQAELKAVPIEIPDSISNEMKRASVRIWQTATELANAEVIKIKEEATTTERKIREELAEYESEVLRLEKELETANETKSHAENSIKETTHKLTAEKEKNIIITTQLGERDREIERLHNDHATLQAELVAIAKNEQPKVSKVDKPTKAKQKGLFKESEQEPKEPPILISTKKGERLAKYSHKGNHWHGLGSKPKWLNEYQAGGGELKDIRVNKNFKMVDSEITRI